MLKKHFGQNILINKTVTEDIVACAEITKDDIVIEIGAGTGHLTSQIALNAGSVIAFEIDRDFFDVLGRVKNENPNIELILTDFLKYDLKQLFVKEAPDKKYILMGNIPYNITSPIITKVFQKDILSRFSKIILMTQLEYAERLMAKPGGRVYGSITVFMNYHAIVEIIRKVSKGNFKPVPKVDSAVIKITPLAKPRYECDEKLLFKIVRASFCQRRKKIINSLRNSEFYKNNVGACHGVPLQEIFEKSGINPSLRAEDLSLEDYVKLTKEIELTF